MKGDEAGAQIASLLGLVVNPIGPSTCSRPRRWRATARLLSPCFPATPSWLEEGFQADQTSHACCSCRFHPGGLHRQRRRPRGCCQSGWRRYYRLPRRFLRVSSSTVSVLAIDCVEFYPFLKTSSRNARSIVNSRYPPLPPKVQHMQNVVGWNCAMRSVAPQLTYLWCPRQAFGPPLL